MEISKRFVRRTLMWGGGIAVVCGLHPVHNRLFEAGMFAGLGVVWVAALVALAGNKASRALVFFAPLLAVIPFILPGKPLDPESLRAGYVANLRKYDGTRYVWGGESPLGIDCSGLPRRALRDALWSEGWRSFNGTSFRTWLAQWWFDSSALAMGQGYRGRTRPLGISGPLWDIGKSPLLPGDLAVRGDGHHVVAYLGDRQWIEADPNLGKVHRWFSTTDDGRWYQDMSVHRWTVTEAATR